MITKKRKANPLDRKVGKAVRDRRQAKNLTLEAAAKKLGCSLSQQSRYERGESTIELPVLRKMAQLLGCLIADLVVDIEPRSP